MRIRACSSKIAPFLLSLAALAQGPELSKTVQEFVRVHASKVILTHVRIIDGTGADGLEDRNIVIEGGKITAILRGSMLLPPTVRR